MSERTVYAIASGKGGVGKTTTAINLGAMLADRGHSVVVVDTDLGMANLADFLDFEIETPTLHEVLAGDADFEDAIDRAPGEIDVLPSATDIEAFVRSDPTNLGSVVADLREEHDYVLLDTGAGVSYDTLVPLALADTVLLVATPDVASVRDTAKTGKLAERVESEVAGAVLTQRSSDILNADDVEETLGTDVLAVVPQDEAVPMGIDAGRPLAAFAPNAPAAQAYRELAAVLTGEADPDPELDLGTGTDDGDAPGPDGDDELDADSFTGSELAESVRDAIGEGDETEGLLGGELATAADEIRKQAGAGSAGAPPDSADDRRTEIDADEDASDGEAAGRSDASGARSVDDLINEHISDDRLEGETDSFGDADDPLAGMADDPPAGGEDPNASGFLDEESDPLGDAEGSLGDEEGPLGDAEESLGNEKGSLEDSADPRTDERGTSDPAEVADSPSERAKSDADASDDGSEWTDSDGTNWDDEGEGRSEDREDDRTSSAHSTPFEADESRVGSRRTERGDEREADEPEIRDSLRGEGTSDETPAEDESESDGKDESGGLLSRIGSLFK